MRSLIAIMIIAIVGAFATVAIMLVAHDRKINRFDNHCHTMGGTALHARDLSLCVRNGLIVSHT